MYQLLESIRIENKNAPLLAFHQARMEQSFAHFGKECKINISQILNNLDFENHNLFKLRIIYDLENHFETEIQDYQFAKIDKFRLIENDKISYSLKYADRTALDQIKKENPAQEIIITQNGKITDTSFSNLIFLKNGIWHTPKTYLLNGVRRQFLLQNKQIIESDIHFKNIHQFSHFKLINAMIGIDDGTIWRCDDILI